MVKIKERDYILSDGTIDIQAWLQEVAIKRQSHGVKLIGQACILSQLTGGNHIIYEDQTCLQQGIKMAEILLDLNVDQETIAAAILYNNVEYSDLSLDDIAEQLGPGIAKLITGAQQMEATRAFFRHQYYHEAQNRSYIDNMRKMLLAMVEDVRVVLIKLAERTCIIRQAFKFSEEIQQQLATEISHIYAPLANRLGIGQIKWELEDSCLRYLEPKAYKEIAKLLAAKRIDREHYIELVINQLKENLEKNGISNCELSGRAKHINSIYRKMKRKDVDYNQIYDVSAVRVLVPTIEDCYSVLSLVHALWQPIPEEFDDYIAHPKENGYRSLHTAVIGPHHKNLEVQIRTYEMHKESELGVAAHWKYKEGRQQKSDYEEKIAWLRQVLDWQKEISKQNESPQTHHTRKAFDDHIYVFTPKGEIIDLPYGSTPLDFAYHIHSEIGHHCRGAKVNGKMVPLTHLLKTGERVEIITSKNATPSRDWLNNHAGYLATTRAKAKVHHWFKQEDYANKITEGQAILENELKRLGPEFLHNRINFEKVARKLNLKSASDIYLGLSNGDLRPGNVITTIQDLLKLPKAITPTTKLPFPSSVVEKSSTLREDIQIHGVDNLLTYNARCCKPLPGDPIIGYITKGRGISIHRQDCSNIQHSKQLERFVDVSWTGAKQRDYPVDITITATERQHLLRDILSVLTNEKIHLLGIKTQSNPGKNLLYMTITVEIENLPKLQHLLSQLKQLPETIAVNRYTHGNGINKS